MIYACIGFVFVCARETTWEHLNPPNCSIPSYLPLSQLVLSIIADAILVVVPIVLMKTMKSDPTLRRRVQVIFAITILLSIVVIVQTILLVKIPGFIHLVAFLVEGFIAIMLCNLSVVFFTLRHLLGYGKKPSPSSASAIELTDITFHTMSPSIGATESRSFRIVRAGASRFLERWRTVGSAIDPDDETVEFTYSDIPRTTQHFTQNVRDNRTV